MANRPSCLGLHLDFLESINIADQLSVVVFVHFGQSNIYENIVYFMRLYIKDDKTR